MRLVKSLSSLYSNLSYTALLVSRQIIFVCVRTGRPIQLYFVKIEVHTQTARSHLPEGNTKKVQMLSFDLKLKKVKPLITTCWTPLTFIPKHLTSASPKPVDTKSTHNVLHTPILPNFRHSQTTELQAHILFVRTPSEHILHDNGITRNAFAKSIMSVSSILSFACHFSRWDAYLQRGRPGGPLLFPCPKSQVISIIH